MKMLIRDFPAGFFEMSHRFLKRFLMTFNIVSDLGKFPASEYGRNMVNHRADQHYGRHITIRLTAYIQFFKHPN